MKDGRRIARENEIRCLRALHRFGWLRTRDFAALCWQRWLGKPSGPLDVGPVQPTGSAIRMAQRTLRRLRDARQVIRAQGPNGSIIYALSEGGVRALKDVGITTISGKDLVRGYSSAYYRHRCIANEIAIAGIVQGLRASTEREIAQGLWLGGEIGIAGKRPDVLLRDGNKVYWIEVERSRKNARDYKALLVWLTKVLRDSTHCDGSRLLRQGQEWRRVIFICTPAFESKLCKDLEAIGWSRQKINMLSSFKSALYHFEETLFP
jgi:hypothetical protein